MDQTTKEKTKRAFNQKQWQVACFDYKYKPEFLICHGAVGSGKTIIELNRYLSHIYDDREQGHDYIMTGYTLPSLKRNVFSYLWRAYGINTDLDDEQSFKIWGNRVYCFGTDDRDAYKAMRGIITAWGHYGNEVTLSHKNSIDEVVNRCRGEGARFFWDCNPTTPNHYVYRTYIEPAIIKGNDKQAGQFNFTLYDNDKAHGGFLPNDYIKRMERTYSGILYAQYILGEWRELSGQVYHLEDLQYYDDNVFTEKSWRLGIIIHGYLDPAAGSKKKTGCYTSMITGAMKNDTIYILDAVVQKLGAQGTKEMVGGRLKRFGYSSIRVEDNFTQDEYVVRPLQIAYPFAPITGMTTTEDKISRLVGMESIVKTKVVFPERFRTDRNSDGWLLLQQLCNITPDHKVDNDNPESFLDAPDALEGLIRTFRTYNSGSSFIISGQEETAEVNRKW